FAAAIAERVSIARPRNRFDIRLGRLLGAVDRDGFRVLRVRLAFRNRVARDTVPRPDLALFVGDIPCDLISELPDWVAGSPELAMEVAIEHCFHPRGGVSQGSILCFAPLLALVGSEVASSLGQAAPKPRRQRARGVVVLVEAEVAGIGIGTVYASVGVQSGRL